jgi:hypothetical protein
MLLKRACGSVDEGRMGPESLPAHRAPNPRLTACLVVGALACGATAALAIGGRSGVWMGVGLVSLFGWRWSFAMLRRAEAAGAERAAARYRRAVVGLPVVVVGAFILLLAQAH